VERVFPVDGEWDVSVGDFVEPFDYLGKVPLFSKLNDSS